MKNIEVAVLNPEDVVVAKKMLHLTAKLTQHGADINTMEDLKALYKEPSDTFVEKMVALPHPTMQRFAKINVAIVGASRRFLAQITRHQDDVHFMSASLQYSDYSGKSNFTVPYELLNKPKLMEQYLNDCEEEMEKYQALIAAGVNHDTAGYEAPQGLRNVLIISATPFQWKHIISQRTCRRNTAETRYILLTIWEQLYHLCPAFFKDAGPFCMNGPCQEGFMCCGDSMNHFKTPTEILDTDYPLIRKQ